MGNKNQGEGDYEAARRFNKAEQDFVQRKLGKKKAAVKGDSHTLSRTDLAGDDLNANEANEVDDHDYDDMDSETTKRVWRPGIELPDQK